MQSHGSSHTHGRSKSPLSRMCKKLKSIYIARSENFKLIAKTLVNSVLKQHLAGISGQRLIGYEVSTAKIQVMKLVSKYVRGTGDKKKRREQN